MSIKLNNKNKQPLALIIIGLSLLLFTIIIVAISIGQVDIPYYQTFQIVANKMFGIEIGNLSSINNSYFNIVWLIRFPRIIIAALIGMGLAICGTVMQASVQNPLADPYILGISSGATLGATFMALVGSSILPILGQYGIAFGAFAGAIIASFLVLVIAQSGGRMTSTKLVLSGTVINSMFSAFSSLIIYFANNAQGLQTVTFWLMGSVASSSWNKVPLLVVIVFGSLLFFWSQNRNLNVMLMGDEVATTLGVNLNFYRKLYLVITALLTGIMVANCGMIGFVGLVIPHITRSIFGSNHKILIPVSALFGANLMVVTDLLARTIIPGSEIPIGIITATIGAPIFLFMLLKKNYGFGG